jgi:hypothetical protein
MIQEEKGSVNEFHAVILVRVVGGRTERVTEGLF